jgi:hypothetical protein
MNDPEADERLATLEQAQRLELLGQVAKFHHVDLAGLATESLATNIPFLRQLAQSVGYHYGMPPHRMAPELKTELSKTGRVFLQGAPPTTDPSKYLDAGLDLFKVFTVELDSRDYHEWKEYLDKGTASMR